MSIRIWNTHRIATDLAKGVMRPSEKFQYLVATNVIWVAAGYVGGFFVNASSGWLYWYECFLILVVTVFGLIRCKENYEGVADDRLLEATVILSVPLSLKFLLFTWIAHYGFSRGLPVLFSSIDTNAESNLFLIGFLAKASYLSYPFLIAAIGSALYYFRMASHLRTIANTVNDVTIPSNDSH